MSYDEHNPYFIKPEDEWSNRLLARLERDETEMGRLPIMGPGIGNKKADAFFDWLIIAILGVVTAGFLALVLEEDKPYTGPIPVGRTPVEQVAASTLP